MNSIAPFPFAVGTDNHYLIHKVASVAVDDGGVLRFQYEDGFGNKKLQGPGYLSKANDYVPLASRMLRESGLTTPADVRYVVAYHSGAYPNGHPACLLRSLLDPIPKTFFGSGGAPSSQLREHQRLEAAIGS